MTTALRAAPARLFAAALVALLAAAMLLVAPGAAPASAASKTHRCTGIEHRRGVSAGKVIEVKVTHGSYATVYLCQRQGKHYVRAGGPYRARIGYNGAAVRKREGDGKTPLGTFTMGRGFGTQQRPSGVRIGWTKVTRKHVWVDGKASKRNGYNTMQKRSKRYKGENLYRPGVYSYAQVINYNTARTPGRGSGIFLHVRGKGATAGCVSLYRSQLLKTLRWEGNTRTQISIHR